MNAETWPTSANELIVRLKFYWSRNYWLVVTPAPDPKDRES